MIKNRTLILILLIHILPIILSAQILDSLTTTVLDSCLSYLHLERSELGFEKAWAKDDTFKLEIVDYLLDNPLELPEYIEETVNTAKESSMKDQIAFVTKQLDIDEKLEYQSTYSTKPENNIVNALDQAEPYLNEFYSKLDTLELHDLIMSAPNLWCGEDDPEDLALKGSWQQEFNVYADTSRSVDKNRLLNIMKKLNRSSLHIAGLIFLNLIEELQCKTSETLVMNNSRKIEGVQGDILHYDQTKYGELIIGGKGENVYSRDFAFIIDLGGDDTYRCRAGGALGTLGNSFSFVIDHDGNDIYFNEERSISMGSGFLGIGILYDMNGNDVYRGTHYSQGSGICGIGILIDSSGEDDYRGGCFTQGAGHYGIGFLKDIGAGDDRYMAKLWAQGFGSTFGYGLLHDTGGDDTYRTGGEYLHAPLLPNDYQSFSHGFGMGWRPRAGGGIGVLYDEAGNDFYDGEVFCEGSAYWYSLGILVDGGGNDSYNAAQYAQGAGIHLAVGALWEQGGDDQYHSRNGVVGGTAHDLSVAMLVDESGDDNYIVSGGYGISLTNSFALFIDKSGDDMYSTWEDHSFGSVRPARGFAGCGIFIDLEGKDRYSRNTLAKDGGLWTYNGWGIGIDLARDIVTEHDEEVVDEIILTAEDSLKTIEELFEEASLWEVGSNTKKVAHAKKAFLQREMEAVQYICDNKMGTDSSLELRLIDTITKEYPDSIAPILLTKIRAENKKIQKNSIRLLGVAKYEPAHSPLIEMLKNGDHYYLKRSLIVALGSIGNTDATDIISDFINDEDELCRLSVISALKKLKDETANEVLIGALDDKMFTVRSAAITALVNLADLNSCNELYNRIKNDKFEYPELALRTLSNIEFKFSDSTRVEYKKQRKRSQKLFVKLINNPDERIRAEAVKAIYLNCDDKKIKWLEVVMKNEEDPFVKDAYEEIIKKDKNAHC
ncbi:MAG: HEAT repeat domain-containing protein [Candidatus Cloacimonetes bacterium]|jgi:HEAT repeat protein|nr:HEAT repeat domain-containing protein [Candidatus Cloacimonadota bacterium]